MESSKSPGATAVVADKSSPRPKPGPGKKPSRKIHRN